jgi:excisionase family DNA binding protein
VTDDGSMKLLDYAGAAELLGCSARLVRKLCEARKIDHVKIGSLVRLEPAAITRYIETHRREAVR